MKQIGYWIFSFFYHLFLLCKVKPNQVCCIMHHDSSKDSNVGMVIQYLKHTAPDTYSFVYITKEDARGIKGKGMIRNFIPFFVGKSYLLATSGYVLLDDVFLPMSCLRFRKQVKVIQLWHGTGTIKKFGQDSNKGQLKNLEYRANQNITHLIVNSTEMMEQYAGAFGVDIDRVYPLGLPRTDTLFEKEKLSANIEAFYQAYPKLRDRQILLYAPTFRDAESQNPQVRLEYAKLLEALPEDWVLVLKLHPHVAAAFSLTREEQDRFAGRLYNLSAYPDLNALMGASTMLITDYSSIIFEYCLQGKPMIFYAYDLEEFSENGRGFYRPYEDFVPGPVAKTTEEVAELIKKGVFDQDRIHDFMADHFEYLDGASTKRLVEKIFHT